jgi:large subunit ribosomal protein L29
MANSDIKTLTEQELRDKITEEKDALSRMLLNHSISAVENPSRVRSNRRSIAKLMTELHKRKTAK